MKSQEINKKSREMASFLDFSRGFKEISPRGEISCFKSRVNPVTRRDFLTFPLFLYIFRREALRITCLFDGFYEDFQEILINPSKSSGLKLHRRPLATRAAQTSLFGAF